TGLFFADSNLGTATQVAKSGLAATQPQTAPVSLAFNNVMQAPLLAATSAHAANFVAHIPQPPDPPPVSEAAHRGLLQDVTTRGGAAWDALASSAATQTRAGGTAAPTGNAEPAAAPAAEAIAPELASDINIALDAVQEISLAAELANAALNPVLHIS